MKPRTVIVTLEIESDAPLSDLRDIDSWYSIGWRGTVRQVQAAVAQPAMTETRKALYYGEWAGIKRPYAANERTRKRGGKR